MLSQNFGRERLAGVRTQDWELGITQDLSQTLPWDSEVSLPCFTTSIQAARAPQLGLVPYRHCTANIPELSSLSALVQRGDRRASPGGF